MSSQNSTGKNIGIFALGIGCGCLLPVVLSFLTLLSSLPFLFNSLKGLQELGNFLEAQSNLSEINTAQQTYFAKNNRFASKISELGLDIKPETENYSYQINIIDAPKSVKTTAKAKKPELFSYTGAAFAVKVESSTNLITITEICQTEAASLNPPAMPKITGIKIQCPSGSTPVGFNDTSTSSTSNL